MRQPLTTLSAPLPHFWGPTPAAGAAALTHVPGGGGIRPAAPTGQGVIGASPDQQNPDRLSRLLTFSRHPKNPRQVSRVLHAAGFPPQTPRGRRSRWPRRPPLCKPKLFMSYVSTIKQKQLWLLPPFT